MSLATNVADLATRAASEDKALRTLINANAPDLSALTTTAKSNLVAAINEVKDSTSSAAGINDGTTSTTSTWSSSKVSTELDGKADTVHTHATSDVTGLDTALAGKADDVHTHAIADVTGLQGALDGKAATGHTHAIADTTGLQGALDGKADDVHTHTSADVSDFTAAVDARVSSVLDIENAPELLNSINELAAAIGDDANFAGTVTTALANRVRFDEAQALTGPQQAQARTNIGAALASDVATLATNVGDTNTDFVAVFETGLA